jgi:hypothetical protein
MPQVGTFRRPDDWTVAHLFAHIIGSEGPGWATFGCTADSTFVYLRYFIQSNPQNEDKPALVLRSV